MNFSGQFLIEIVLSLGLLVIILGILSYFLNVLQQTQKYPTFNQNIALTGFEKYRNVLIALSKNRWNDLNLLASNTNYFLFATNNSWQIATGVETTTLANDVYYFYFQISNYNNTNTLKFVTITAQFKNLQFFDYLILSKINR